MADRELRVSVRRMVEFTLRGGDIAPASPTAMQEGSRGHRARQSAASAESERALSWSGEAEGLSVTVSGRMDLYYAASDPPLIEEMKLLSSGMPPDVPYPPHRMQAACYAFMLCTEQNLPLAGICVSYVNTEGEVKIRFDETITAEAAREAFFSMLLPLARWEAMQAAYRDRRDLSLRQMPFPYPSYRAGQREMAVQAYTAVVQKKRLFASLPTGTGKSAAALFPALKAMGEGKTRQVFYLTARGTAQQAALDALQLMREKGMTARTLSLTAKEKLCPQPFMHCSPDSCPRAKGYFDREAEGLAEMTETDDWCLESLRAAADKNMLCPFEFSLALCEIADVVICDYNYVFDPMIFLKRIFEHSSKITLLIDEAHNLTSRVRDMLSGTLSSAALSEIRREAGKTSGRKNSLYRAFSALIAALRKLDESDSSVPDAVSAALSGTLEKITEGYVPLRPGGYEDCIRTLLSFQIALSRREEAPEDYRVLVSSDGKERTLRLLCLNITDHLAASTKRMQGCVYFSATLSPLQDMRLLLGGGEGDACFALPSPFPPENLLVIRRDLDTRYRFRTDTARQAAEAILAMFDAQAGKYIAFFPSYAYLLLLQRELQSLRETLPLHVQQKNMNEAERDIFLARFRECGGAVLALCVLGGVFAEGIDLPGLSLIGAAVIGVGLPQVNPEQEAVRDYLNGAFGDGFAYAYRYPGMHKVLQAAGRVIRSEQDAGVVLLVDKRYRSKEYASLLPDSWQIRPAADAEEIFRLSQEFWREHRIFSS